MVGAWHDGVVTVPMPSSHNHSGSSPAHDPWGEPQPGGDGAGPYPAFQVRQELRDGLLCALVVTVLGVALGAMWEWLAPHVPLFTDGTAVYLKDPEGEEAIGADGTFVLLSLAFGVVCGAGVFLRNRGGGLGVVLGLTLGAVLGSLVAWRVGMWLGPTSDVVAAAKQAGKGTTFNSPLELQSKVGMLAWPVAALVTNVGLLGAFGIRDPEPEYGDGGW